MSTLKNSVTIPREVNTENDLDFEYLLRIGIRYIASIGGGLWTDYNEHDPGITMLEMLSYAITDLGNRINLPIADLLTGPAGSQPVSGQFYTAGQILPNRAVTPSDYRKLFIDIEGVRNCWIVPFKRTVYADCQHGKLSYMRNAFPNVQPQHLTEFGLKGINTIIVDFDVDENDPERSQKIARIRKAIRRKYHANRNLCEDLAGVKAVKQHPVSVCARIDIENGADEDRVNAEVNFAIYSYFSPFVRFHSLKEMLDKGYSMDKIFEGPLLENGFIDDEELNASGLRREIRLSDLMNLIMDIPGVKNIRDISMGNCDEVNSSDTWMICVKNFSRPVLCKKSTFTYYKDLLPAIVDDTRSESILASLKKAAQASDEGASENMFPVIPSGEYLDTGWYSTIQNDFPDTYGIGHEGLDSSAGAARKSQAKQLKGYLLFFDQVLATYFAYLKNAKDLFSVSTEIKSTAFTQAVKDIAGFQGLVSGYPESNDAELSELLFGQLVNDRERKNEILDQLLGRFAEHLSTYAFSLHKLYGTMTPEMELYSKELFLKEYVTLSSERGLAFNYYHRYNEDQPDTLSRIWRTSNVSGAEKRIARLTGIKNYNRRNLSDNRFFVVNEQPAGVFKWRIRKEISDPLLWSVINRSTYQEASNDIYAASLALIETSEQDVEVAFAAGITPGTVVGNVEIRLSSGNNYYFNIVNPALSPGNPDYRIAKQLLYYTTPEELKAAILDAIRFMKFKFTGEGMFLVEHILLRPKSRNAKTDYFMEFCADDCDDHCCGIDPYSFRVSIVLPGFTPRFADLDFRAFMEKVIREELPAHVLAKICWVGTADGDILPVEGNQLEDFEKLYLEWLKVKTNVVSSDPDIKLLPLIQQLMKLNSIYPEGKLHDCENDDYSGDIILDRSRLGTSK